MTLPLIVLWAFVGWCGTGPRPRFPPPPEPDPWPIYLVSRVIGIVAGIIGGWAYTQLFLPQDPDPLRSGLFAATTAVGAFAVARVVTDVYGMASSRR